MGAGGMGAASPAAGAGAASVWVAPQPPQQLVWQQLFLQLLRFLKRLARKPQRFFSQQLLHESQQVSSQQVLHESQQLCSSQPLCSAQQLCSQQVSSQQESQHESAQQLFL